MSRLEIVWGSSISVSKNFCLQILFLDKIYFKFGWNGTLAGKTAFAIGTERVAVLGQPVNGIAAETSITSSFPNEATNGTLTRPNKLIRTTPVTYHYLLLSQPVSAAFHDAGWAVRKRWQVSSRIHIGHGGATGPTLMVSKPRVTRSSLGARCRAGTWRMRKPRSCDWRTRR